MGIECGSQVAICDVPIRLDTYKNCSHACKYCFVKRTHEILNVEPLHCVEQLARFIEGKRTQKTAWCDWDIPLHWGGMSDPFQPAELEHRCSIECLKLFAKTQYPFIVSTKGRLVAQEPYLSLIGKCNCVVQISMVCSLYDKLEPGAPTYEERLEMLEKVSKVAKRTIVRIQPYIREALPEVLKNLPRLKKAGCYGIVVEGMKYITKRDGLVKVGGDWCYPSDLLRKDFNQIRKVAHECGLRFFCGENRLRFMGDNLCCCGIEGLEGFVPNCFNANHLLGGESPQPTDSMKKIGTAEPFKGIDQTSEGSQKLRQMSFAQQMIYYINEKAKTILGLSTGGRKNLTK